MKYRVFNNQQKFIFQQKIEFFRKENSWKIRTISSTKSGKKKRSHAFLKWLFLDTFISYFYMFLLSIFVQINTLFIDKLFFLVIFHQRFFPLKVYFFLHTKKIPKNESNQCDFSQNSFQKTKNNKKQNKNGRNCFFSFLSFFHLFLFFQSPKSFRFTFFNFQVTNLYFIYLIN